MSLARPFTVVAIIAAHNEADVIEHVVRDLIEQGVSVYVIDDDSTDGTREIVERYVGRGVLAVEQFDGTPGVFQLERILRRKTELAETLDADWFINSDADEFRESPWLGLPLCEAIAHVDRLGFNAIDFVLLDFWPVDDSFESGTDVRQAHRYYAPGNPYNRVQIRCWKRTAAPVDLVESGGHDACFEGRDVYPIPFLLRHYPIRSEAHGRRKMVVERRPRFDPAERERGWHVQYDGLEDNPDLIRRRESLTEYDPVRVRRALLSARYGMAVADTPVAHADGAAPGDTVENSRRRLQEAVALVNEHVEAVTRLRNDAHLQRQRIADLQRTLHEQQHQIGQLTDKLRELHESLSWRLTAPARTAYRVLTRRSH